MERTLERNMGEPLEVYDLKSRLLEVSPRKKYYIDIEKEFRETGKITKKVKSIRVLLMNSKGRIYLQKRSKSKEVNPGCYDKTLGGHIGAGQSWDMTLIKECAEELGFPATVVPIEEFDETVNVTDISVVGIFKKVDYIPNFISKRKSQKGDFIEQPWMTTIYFGYYDGGIRFVDGESTGIEVFSLEELKEEIEQNPDKFTEDILFMINKYEHLLKSANELV